MWSDILPELLTIFAANAMAVGIAMLALWLLSLVIKDASIIDMFWAPGCWLVAFVSFVAASDPGFLAGLALMLTTLWATRLGFYLINRNLGKGEDARYASLRDRKKPFWLWSLFGVFITQGLAMLVITLPVQIAPALPADTPLGIVGLLGVLVWLAGFLFETISDWQLARFKANPDNKGKILDTGLWAWSRHPNYFGNACIWWGLFLLVAGTPVALWTVIGPVVMTYFLLNVTGAAFLENWMRRKDVSYDYDAYANRISSFFPRPPRKTNS